MFTILYLAARINNDLRRSRAELSREFNDDSQALLDYIKKKDKKREQKVISRPSRPVISENKAN